MPEYTTIRVEAPAERVARIVLSRPDTRNAQSIRLLYELNDAFDLAAADDDVRVIILAADGPHFSSGHDLRDDEGRQALADFPTVGTWCCFGAPGAEGHMAIEKEVYLGFCERWRNLPKPTIAAVQGKVIAGGLMLVWPCDLIVAAEDAVFLDNTVAMGVAGVELFHHPFEVGARIAKELLFTTDAITAAEAKQLGMVNRVVPNDQLEAATLALANRIAEQPSFALRLAKESVNAAQDAGGRASALQTAFAHHQLCHSHNREQHGMLIDPAFLARSPLGAR